MQNVKIDIYISDLLYQYDCVVIPDFGGFVANYASAKVQAVQHKIVPPSKQISFNKNLKSNDGLLSNYLAQKKELTYIEANQIIQSFVNQTLSGLDKGDKIVIEKVGTLFLDPERNIQFKAEENNDFLLDSFGLGTLRVQPIKRGGAEQRIEKHIENVIPLIQEEERKKRKYYWPAAAILVLLLTFLLNQQFNWVKTTQVSYSGLGINTTDLAKFTERDATANFSEVDLTDEDKTTTKAGNNYAIDNILTGVVLENETNNNIAAVDNTSVAKENISTSLKFHVMGGCFSNLANAEGLANSLKDSGYDARLLGTYKNLYAVSFGSFSNREAAINLLRQVKSSENSAAWLLNKPF